MGTRTRGRAATNRAVVVGVDGSRTAWSALAWAADDAGRRELPLRIVHVREPWLTERLGSESETSDTVVVGCDASLCADLALEYAPAQAVVRRARLRVLHGRRSPLTAPNPAGLRAVAR